MERIPRPLIPLFAQIGVAPAFGADIAFFEWNRLRRRSFTANRTIPNLADIVLNGRAPSLRIEAGHRQR